MKSFLLTCLALSSSLSSPAQTTPKVLVMDSGTTTVTIGPGAPKHTVGLQGRRQVIALNTGVQTFGLRYVVALDPKNPQAAIPGEGYIGMPQPVDCNWYASGFFDLRINGQSVGTTLIHSLTGRSSEGRGTVDFAFAPPQAVVRIRFVAKPGGDCLYAQALLEPKVEIKSLRLSVRCYPSAFVQDAERHVLTPQRDLEQGKRADLNVTEEWWTMYYDRIFDQGYVAPSHTGVGPCAMLWLPTQIAKAGFTVGNYGIDTVFDLQPAQRDFRFLFFDFAGKKNEEAKSSIRSRAPNLRAELASFPFFDPSVVNWPLPQKRAELQEMLTKLPTEKNAAAVYERRFNELSAQLKLLQSAGAGAIMAEAGAAKIIAEWEKGLPELKLQALLNGI